MPCSNIQVGSNTQSDAHAGFGLNDPTSIIGAEPQWRCRPDNPSDISSEPRVHATRWRALDDSTREAAAGTSQNFHVIGIVLRKTRVWFSVAGRTVLDGAAMPGMVHVTEPGVAVRCVFRGSYDALHLHVPNDLIIECARDLPSDRPAGRLLAGNAITKDQTVERLAYSLLAADQIGAGFGRLYADCISVSIVARLLGSVQLAGPPERPKVAALAKWRLKRAIDFVEANLAEPVGLADIAAVTGLTRMHFAAQFRAATGLRPHEYLLRRRIERAQQLLAAESSSVVNIALSVGFQSQSHFTSIFTRFVGQPPRAWRQSQHDYRWRERAVALQDRPGRDDQPCPSILEGTMQIDKNTMLRSRNSFPPIPSGWSATPG
jgi:AraC family transcriptional regulator